VTRIVDRKVICLFPAVSQLLKAAGGGMLWKKACQIKAKQATLRDDGKKSGKIEYFFAKVAY
jgi:hypothetical protein